jgi:hypothetical protein
MKPAMPPGTTGHFDFDAASKLERSAYAKGWRDAGGGEHQVKPKPARSNAASYLAGYADAIKNTRAQSGG